MDRSSELVRLTAQFTEVYTRLDLAWNELRSELFIKIAPTVIKHLEIIIMHVQAANASIDIVWPAVIAGLKNTGIVGYGLAVLLEQIAQNTAPKPEFVPGVLQDIENFMSLANADGLPKSIFKQVNPVP